MARKAAQTDEETGLAAETVTAGETVRVPEIPEEKIRISGGMEWTGRAAKDFDRTLWLFIKEPISMMTIAAVFSDAEKIREIAWMIGGKVMGEWEGYTELYAIKRREEETAIALRRPETGAGDAETIAAGESSTETTDATQGENTAETAASGTDGAGETGEGVPEAPVDEYAGDGAGEVE